MKPKQIVKNMWGNSSPESIEFEALAEFFQTAGKNQILQFEDACRKNDWDGFKKRIEDVKSP